MFCKKKCSPSRSFCHLHLSSLVWIDVARVQLYLNTKQSALNVRKPLEPHLCSWPFGLVLRPFRPRAYRDPPTLAEQFNHCFSYTKYDTRCYYNVRSKAHISQLNLPHETNN